MNPTESPIDTTQKTLVERLEALSLFNRGNVRAIVHQHEAEQQEKLREGISALYGCREVLGNVANIQHAIDCLESLLIKE